MGKKTFIIFISFLAIFFLTAQSCSFGAVGTGPSADCVETGDIVCDGDSSYTCELASYGVGYYLSRASEYDAEYCGAVDTTDTDGDGVYDANDLCEGYDDSEDADGDTTPDGCDTDLSLDLDGDGYSNMMEVSAGSDPEDATSVPSARDVDNDGMPDVWERHYGLDNAVDDSGDDEDGDLLTNLEEYEYGIDPTTADTDGDGFDDLYEKFTSYTDPTDPASIPAACIDGIDNDNNGVVDFPADSGCSSETDIQEMSVLLGSSSSEPQALEVVDVVSARGTLNSDLYFMTYEWLESSTPAGMAMLRTSGVFTDDNSRNPSQASPLMVWFVNPGLDEYDQWQGLNGEEIIITSELSAITKTMQITLPTIAEADMTNYYLLFYVGTDGSLYYADENNDGTDSSLSDLLGPDEALTATNLVS